MNRIKKVLVSKQLTQTWLSEKLGKSYNMINSYAQNRRQPSLVVLYEIAELLNIDVKELIKSNR
jgi:putative transcriptional regulator